MKLSGSVIKCWQKANLRRKEFVPPCTLQSIVTKRSQGRNLETESEAETMAEGRLVPCFLLHWSVTDLDHVPRDGTVYSGLGLLASVSNKDNGMKTLSQASLMEKAPKLRFPLPKCQLDKSKLVYMFSIVKTLDSATKKKEFGLKMKAPGNTLELWRWVYLSSWTNKSMCKSQIYFPNTNSKRFNS